MKPIEVEVDLGSFDRPDRNGVVFPTAEVEQFLSPDGALQRRINRNALRAEFGSPAAEAASYDAQARAQRVGLIDESRVCGMFTGVGVRGAAPDRRVVGRIVPDGPYGHVLEKLIEQKSTLTFGIRCFVKHPAKDEDAPPVIRDIVTWDLIDHDPKEPQ